MLGLAFLEKHNIIMLGLRPPRSGAGMGVGMLMVFWFYGFMVLWFHGFMVSWFYSFMVLWLLSFR